MQSRPIPPRRRKPEKTQPEYWHTIVAEFMPQIVWTMLPDGSVDFCSRYWTEYTGLSRQASLGFGWTAALHPEDLERARNWWHGVTRGAPEADVRYRFRRAADGSYRWHLGRAKPVLDRSGKIVKWISTAVDIHDQVEAEEALRASEVRHRNLVELSQDAIYVRSEGKFVFANSATARIYGVATPEELIGQVIERFVHPDYIPMVRERVRKLDVERMQLPPAELKIVRKDGTVRDIESIASPIEYQGLPAAHVVVRDVTDRKALERHQIQLLREQAAHAQTVAAAEHFRLLAEAVPNIVWTARPDGYLDYVNQRSLDFLKLSLTDLEGWGWEQVIHPEDLPKCRERWQHSLTSGENYETELRLWRETSAEYRWHLVRALPVRGTGGRILRWVGTSTDIHDKKEAEAILRQSYASLEEAVRVRTADLMQANQALRLEISEREQAERALRSSQEKLRKLSAHLQSARESERAAVAREIHDELGATLTAVKMDLHWYAKTLAGGGYLSSDKLIETAALVVSAIHTVKRIATELRPSILDHLGLWPALEWQIQEFQKHYGIRCSLEIESPPVALDSEMQTAIFRIAQEALTNVARHARATQVSVRARHAGGRVKMEIEDNGIGLPAAKVVDPASCGIQGMRERAQTFGGEVRFLPGEGTGTRVLITFPVKFGTGKTTSAAREAV